MIEPIPVPKEQFLPPSPSAPPPVAKKGMAVTPPPVPPRLDPEVS